MSNYTKSLTNRAQPTDDWIEQIRNRFPVERTMDEVLTRKLKDRNNDCEQSMDFSALDADLLAYLKRQTGQQNLATRDLKRLTGGASKEQFTFELDWENSSTKRETQKMILRMDPLESVVETHRMREAQVLKAMWEEIPVPEVFWAESTVEDLGRPFLIAGFLEGTVQPEDGGKMTGIGMYFEPKLREALKNQFIEHLATIHGVDWRKKDLSTYDAPKPGTKEANLWSLGAWERIWHEDTLGAHPVVEQTALWLRENMPVVENPVIVHGDYRSGNFMYDDSNQINAILDWELCHLGDYHEDLSYIGIKLMACPDEAGNLLACGLAPYKEFLEAYENLTGNPIDPQKLHYYDVFNHYKTAAITATGLRVAYGRKTHLDAMMNMIGGLGSVTTARLCNLLDL